MKGFVRVNCRVQTWFKRSALWVAAFAIAGGSSLPLSAGEPIIFGKEKTKADPIKDTKFGKELSKPWENLPESSPFNGIVPPILPRGTPQDPKKDKRRKAELEEKKNWMLYEKGELQDKAEEEEQFGVREYNLEGAEKEDGSIRDLTFRRMDKNRGHSRSPGQSRTSSQQQRDNANQAAEQQRERVQADAEAERESRKLDLRGTGQSEAGAISAGLDMKTLFDPNKARSAENANVALTDVLKSGAAPAPALSRQQIDRHEDFKRFLNGPSAANPLAGPSAPVNPRIDFTRPVNPVFPKAADPTLKNADPTVSRSGPNNPYADAYNVSRYPRTPGFLPLGPPEPSRPPASSFGIEPPQRRGIGGGH